MKINQHQCDSCGKREDTGDSYPTPDGWVSVVYGPVIFADLCAQCWDEIKGRFKKV